MVTVLEKNEPRTLDPQAGGMGPIVSVVVPVRNEEAFIEKTLLQLLSQDFPANGYEIIVADGRSTDATREVVARLAERHSNLILVDNPGLWSSRGRNRAVQAARGEIVVVIDGHCEINNDRYLADMVSAFEVSGADSVGRPQPLNVTRASELQKAIAFSRSCSLGHHPSSFIYSDACRFVPADSVAVAYRKRVFDQIGYFDENFDACEDYEFNCRLRRANLTCFFSPRVKVNYFPRESLSSLFRQMARYGTGRIRLLRKHSWTLSWPGLLPAFFLVGLIAGPLAACLFSQLWIVYFSVLGIYSALLAGMSFTALFQTGRLGFSLLVPLVLLTIHLGAGWGIIKEYLAPNHNTPGNEL